MIAERAACKRPAIVPAISLTRGTLIAAVGADRTLTEDTVAMGPTEARLAEVARFLEARGRRRLNILASGRTQAGDPGASRLLSWAVSNLPASFAFRLRFKPRGVFPFAHDECEVVLHQSADTVVKLRAVGPSTIGDSEWLALYGEKYLSEDDAARAGDYWRGAFERSLAAFRVAADFGERNFNGSHSPELLRIASEASGRLVLSDVHGLMVVPADREVFYFRGSASGFATQSVEQLRVTLTSGLNQERHAQQKLAFDLYSAGLMAQSVDARFLLLIASVEALMTEFGRAAEVQALVDVMISEIAKASVDLDEKQRLLSAVSRLKVASFGQQGEQLALSLGDREYGGMPAVKFFKRCYAVRGRVTHGSASRPSQAELTELTAGLTGFVGDLLAGPNLVDELADRTREARP